MSKKCEGNCDPHRGEVRRCHVQHGLKDWGVFVYCEEAREKDIAQGMTVEMLDKFPVTHCSQCGREFGPGDHGYSHCEDHQQQEIHE